VPQKSRKAMVDRPLRRSGGYREFVPIQIPALTASVGRRAHASLRQDLEHVAVDFHDLEASLYLRRDFWVIRSESPHPTFIRLSVSFGITTPVDVQTAVSLSVNAMGALRDP
jgi:hypothetical protein